VGRGRLASALASLVVATAGIAARATPLPQPGTPAQVAALVAASSRIERLPRNLVPPLAALPADNAASYYPATWRGCSSVTQCVYGDRASATTVLLLGDSHAAMWLPPLVWVGHRLSFKVVLLWYPRCPVADIEVWDPTTHSVNTGCTAFRASALKAIAHVAPALVLTANRTTNILGANDRPIPSAVWQQGLETTIATLLADKLHVAVVGDLTMLSENASVCLAAYPRAVQRCSSPNPNPAKRTHRADEIAAAEAEGVPYLDPQPWLCTTTCSPVVGRYAAMNDAQHVSATYAAYLSIEWEDVLKPLLPVT
jgi:hypothetical protein